jgi:hypothetical protein
VPSELLFVPDASPDYTVDNIRSSIVSSRFLHRLLLLGWLLTMGLCAWPAGAAPEAAHTRPAATQSQVDFAAGRWEFEESTGAFFSLNDGTFRPQINYAVQTARLGVMLSNPHGSGALAGNFELLAEVLGGAIFQGPGDVVAGGDMIIRYNFVQPRARLVPYLEGGFGGIYSDISDSPSQTLLGSKANFLEQATLGIRSRLNQKWSLLLQATYYHMSNAGLTSRNSGLDSFGGTAGLRYLF